MLLLRVIDAICRGVYTVLNYRQLHAKRFENRGKRLEGGVALLGKGAIEGFSLDAGVFGNSGHLASLSHIFERLEKGLWGIVESGVQIGRSFAGVLQRI